MTEISPKITKSHQPPNIWILEHDIQTNPTKTKGIICMSLLSHKQHFKN